MVIQVIKSEIGNPSKQSITVWVLKQIGMFRLFALHLGYFGGNCRPIYVKVNCAIIMCVARERFICNFQFVLPFFFCPLTISVHV